MKDCKNCKDRRIGCHSECEKYKQWKSKRLAMRKTMIMESDIKDYQIKQMIKNKKK